MLVSLIVDNYLSFDAEVELSLVANPSHLVRAHRLGVVPGAAHRLLPVAALFGANASGKSNTLSALRALRSATLDGAVPAGSFFSQTARPIRIEVRFVAEDMLLEYGLCSLDGIVSSEWLGAVRIDGEENDDDGVVFERLAGREGQSELLLRSFDGHPNKHLRAFQALGVKPTDTIFTSLLKHELTAHLPRAFAAATRWFERLQFVAPSSTASLVRRAHDEPMFLAHLSAQAQLADPTIAGVAVAASTIGEDVMDLVLEHESGGVRKRVPLTEASTGLRSLLHLSQATFDAGREVVAVVDDFGRGLHPLLVTAVIQAFLQRSSVASQLILATHSTSLLGSDVLRPDEVWFAEKNPAGATQLFSLDDFPARPDGQNVERAYLRGRFGAVPASLTIRD